MKMFEIVVPGNQSIKVIGTCSMKLLCWEPHKFTGAQNLLEANCDVRVGFCHQCCSAVFSGEVTLC